jgi:hypothetical protein
LVSRVRKSLVHLVRAVLSSVRLSPLALRLARRWLLHFSNGTEAAKDFKKEIDELTEGFDKLGDAARTVAIRDISEDIEKAEEKYKRLGTH